MSVLAGQMTTWSIRKTDYGLGPGENAKMIEEAWQDAQMHNVGAPKKKKSLTVASSSPSFQNLSAFSSYVARARFGTVFCCGSFASGALWDHFLALCVSRTP